MAVGEVRILLVGTGRNWSRAVHRAAVSASVDKLDVVASGYDAIERIVTTVPSYSHVLLQPKAADGLIRALSGLTSGEPGSGPLLVLLGSVRPPHPWLPRIPRPDSAAIAAALQGSGARRASPSTTTSHLDFAEMFDSYGVEIRYQPIIRMSDGRCVGFEALARMNHPAHGIFFPTSFVDRLERAGLATDLTNAVASSAFAGLAATEPGAETLHLSINVPLETILDDAAMVEIDRRRGDAGVPRERVTFELTESRPVEDVAALRRSVQRLRKEGFGVAVDDLSPAVPHHAALLEMPFSAVKLDGALVRRAPDGDGSAFLRDAIKVARENGAVVIAEGVEDSDNWDTLVGLGVDQVQGFFVSRPLPAAALPVWLSNWPERRTQLPGMLRGAPDHTSR